MRLRVRGALEILARTFSTRSSRARPYVSRAACGHALSHSARTCSHALVGAIFAYSSSRVRERVHARERARVRFQVGMGARDAQASAGCHLLLGSSFVVCAGSVGACVFCLTITMSPSRSIAELLAFHNSAQFRNQAKTTRVGVFGVISGSLPRGRAFARSWALIALRCS